MTKNSWLELSGDLILFGPGGVTRVTSNAGFNPVTQKPQTGTLLRSELGREIYVNESVSDIRMRLGMPIIVRDAVFGDED